MNKSSVLIFGSSGHAKVIIDIFEKDERFEIIGLIDDFRNIGEKTLDYKVLGKGDDIAVLNKKYPDAMIFVAVGDNWMRQIVVNKIISIVPEIKFATAIHPSAQIGKNVKIGRGVAIMAGTIINSDSFLGDFTIVNTKASIDHDCKLFQYASVAPGTVLGGNVTVGEYSAISIGAVIKNEIKIGKHSIIGAGALVLKDCEDNVVMYGCHAKKIRDRIAGEKYL
jgi:sugar O-acyltransferase (sialic acid O-acetyltransferase NeuD family)